MKAVSVGYYFAVVNDEVVKNINLRETGEKVRYEGMILPVFCGETYEDSVRVDRVLDIYGQYNLSKYKVK